MVYAPLKYVDFIEKQPKQWVPVEAFPYSLGSARLLHRICLVGGRMQNITRGRHAQG